MKLCQRNKGILTLFGGFCIHLACGTLYSFGLLSPFIVSYLRITDPDIYLDDGFFLLPLGILFMKATIVFGGMFEHRFGPKL
jgi:hypothetical protein